MTEIRLENVTKIYAGGVQAVDNVSLTIRSGEFMVLVGPSGCGKSTLLRMVAGLEEVTEGWVFLDERDVTDLAPRERDIAMVFQSYALYPHMTVEKNLGYALKVRGTPKKEITSKVNTVAHMLGLEELLRRRPGALSGGQRQRVAMGRAIIREPKAFLMDEPLSNLDAKLRVGMRAELARLHDRLTTTTIYVTHDQVEAMTLGQRVAVMRDGTIQQVDTPQMLYRSPENLFVAAFIGSPSMNLVEAELDGDTAAFAGFRVRLGAARPQALESGRIILGIRPQEFEDAQFADPSLPTLDVEPAVVEELGAETHIVFPIDAPPVDVESVRAATDERETTLLLAADQRALFTAAVSEGTAARPGERLRLAVNSSRFHFFDVETGANLSQATPQPRLKDN